MILATMTYNRERPILLLANNMQDMWAFLLKKDFKPDNIEFKNASEQILETSNIVKVEPIQIKPPIWDTVHVDSVWETHKHRVTLDNKVIKLKGDQETVEIILDLIKRKSRYLSSY